MKIRRRASKKHEVAATDRWLVHGRICFRITGVVLAANFGYTFVRIDKSFSEASWLEHELGRQLEGIWGTRAQNGSHWKAAGSIEPLHLPKEQDISDTSMTKILPVLTVYGTADDNPDNEQLPHPHAGARFADGKLGLVVNPDPQRMDLNGKRPLDCPKGPFPGIEEDGGYDALQKIRSGLTQSKQFIQEESSKGRKVPRILCMVYAHAGSHDRVRAIANTWGKDCDGFFAASTKTDHTIGAINLLHKGDEHYENMWQKVRSIWAYAYDYYKDDYDYFHICGDDAFVIPDNLRAYAMPEEVKRLEEGYVDAFSKSIPSAPGAAKIRPRYLVFGAPHFWSGKGVFPDGGPGYTFNRAALNLFVEDGLPKILPDLRDPREDVFVGGYFREKGHFVVDTRDSEGGARYIDTDLDHQSKPRWMVASSGVVCHQLDWSRNSILSGLISWVAFHHRQ